MLATALFGLSLLAGAPQDVPGQPTPPAQDDPATTVDDVVVVGRTIEEQARAYVETLTAAPGRSRLARWRSTVCVGVTGLDAAYAQFLVDRVSAVAASVGLDPGDPGCRADVLIAFTRDPDALAQRWVARDREVFQPYAYNQGQLGSEALERFQSSDAPVRWWHIAYTANAQSGLRITRLRGEEGYPVNQLNTPSLIQSASREQLLNTIVIVDANQIGPVSFGSLSDYLALLSLTQADPEAETAGFDTVLNLFSTQPTARLSAWDIDYLQALYRTGSNPARAGLQGRQIARGLANRRTEAAAVAPSAQ